MSHTHADDRLTFGCAGCIAAADEARWTNAPVRRIKFEAWVPQHIAMNKGKRIVWTFTADCRIPDGLNTDTEELDYGRFDVGAQMYKTMPKLGLRKQMEALVTAELRIVRVDPLPAPEQGWTQEAML